MPGSVSRSSTAPSPMPGSVSRSSTAFSLTLAQSRGLSVEGIPLYWLDINSLRLENPKHLRRLEATLDEHRPRLLVLDPLVRVACVDENSAAEVDGDSYRLKEAKEQSALRGPSSKEVKRGAETHMIITIAASKASWLRRRRNRPPRQTWGDKIRRGW